MSNNIYILSLSDEWESYNSMRIVGVTTDETMLHAMIAAKIKGGDMAYGGDKDQSWSMFLHDVKESDVNFNKLKYGFVQTYEDMQMSEPISMSEFPEVATAYEEITNE